MCIRQWARAGHGPHERKGRNGREPGTGSAFLQGFFPGAAVNVTNRRLKCIIRLGNDSGTPNLRRPGRNHRVHRGPGRVDRRTTGRRKDRSKPGKQGKGSNGKPGRRPAYRRPAHGPGSRGRRGNGHRRETKRHRQPGLFTAAPRNGRHGSRGAAGTEPERATFSPAIGGSPCMPCGNCPGLVTAGVCRPIMGAVRRAESFECGGGGFQETRCHARRVPDVAQPPHVMLCYVKSR
eukprot:gene7777-biopygen16584